MTVSSGFFNSLNGDRLYNAAQMSEYYRGILRDGVVANYGGALQVVADSGLTIQVNSGRAYIDSRWLENDAPIELTLTAPHVTLNRYTAIVVQLDYGNREMSIITIDGTNASSPTKPAMTNNASIKQICLAYVYVAAGATSISQSNITDTRSNNNVCGWVTGLINQVDTTTLFGQWQAAYDENIADMEGWETAQKTAFENWLDTLTSQLTVGAYVKEYEKDITLTSSDLPIVALDWDGYTYSSNDVVFVYINGLYARQGYDYTINTGDDPVSISFSNIDTPNDEWVYIKVLKSKLGTLV